MRCYRTLPAWITFAVILLFSVPVIASGSALGVDDPVINKARDFLKLSQSNDGSIGNYTDTAWCVMSLAASGAGTENWVESAVSYLKNNPDQLEESYNLAADLARNILAIVSVDLDPYSFGSGNATVPSGNYISALAGIHDGTQFGVPDSINEDCWAIIALIAAGYSRDSTLITSTVSYIEKNQGADNGWSWAAPFNDYYFESDPDNTAAAIMALKCAGQNSQSIAIKKGLEYLEKAQRESGGFGSYGVVNTGSTAWVISALNSLSLDPASWQVSGSNPVDYLKSMQAPDGSFKFADPMPDNYMPMSEKMTADSIVALTGNTYPVTSSRGSNLTAGWVSVSAIAVSLVVITTWFLKRRR